jgi:hypothetical protein
MKIVPLHKISNELANPDLHLLEERILYFEYERNGKLWRTGFRFQDVAAIQIRSLWCLEDWVDPTYYTLVEVIDSPWKESVLGLVEEEEAWYRQDKHHYAILDASFSYEFIAGSWQLLPDEEG